MSYQMLNVPFVITKLSPDTCKETTEVNQFCLVSVASTEEHTKFIHDWCADKVAQYIRNVYLSEYYKHISKNDISTYANFITQMRDYTQKHSLPVPFIKIQWFNNELAKWETFDNNMPLLTIVIMSVPSKLKHILSVEKSEYIWPLCALPPT